MRFDVCLSFAGEDRPYIAKVAEALRLRDVRVFYDAQYETELWGKDLYQYLDDVYRRQARFCVVFVSAAYVAKQWTNHELRSAQARAFESSQEYLLPARFDATELPGLPPTTGYIDIRDRSPESLADLIAAKVRYSTAPSIDVDKEMEALRREITRLHHDRSALTRQLDAIRHDYTSLRQHAHNISLVEDELREELTAIASAAQEPNSVAPSASLTGLKARYAEAQLGTQFLEQHRIVMADTIAELLRAATAESAIEPRLQTRIAQLQDHDAMLAAHVKRIDAQRAAIQPDLDAVQRIISKNIAESFRLLKE